MNAYIDQIARGEIVVDAGPSEPRLGCCEYKRASNGKVRNVLQCFCECDDVDETMDHLLTRGQMPTRSQMRRIEDDCTDRIRLPWVTGAVRVNPWIIFIPLILYAEVWLVEMTDSTVMLPCTIFSVFLYTSVTFMTSADRARSKMHASFTAWTIVQVVFAYFAILRHSVSASYDVVAVLLVAVILLNAWHVHFGDPGHLPDLSPPVKSSKDDLAKYYISNGLRRAKYCRISNRVIAHYDHYCIWLGAPIGKLNHGSFLLFLVSVSLGGFLFFWKSISIPVVFMIDEDHTGRSTQSNFLTLCSTHALLGAIGCSALLLRQCYLISLGMTTYESLHQKTLLFHAKQVGSKFPSNLWRHGRWALIWDSLLAFGGGQRSVDNCSSPCSGNDEA